MKGWILGLLVTVPACLMPPPIEEGPPVENDPPRILPESLTPDPTDGPKLMSTQCEQYRFFASVSDPDAFDTLYWRVFIDYHRDEVALQTVIHTEAPDESRPGSTRLLTFAVNPTDSRFDVLQRLNEPHTVELFVSDRPFFDGPKEPLARAMTGDGLADTFIWTIALTDAACTTGGL